jgi:quaternary ammonium compound-resistance protein SugE
MQAWLALLMAGLLEIGWPLGLKYSEGFTRFWPSIATVLAIGCSFGLLAIALESVPFGVAYAVWAGIGVAGTAIVGIVLFGESADAGRITCLTLILAGIIGLNLASH